MSDPFDIGAPFPFGFTISALKDGHQVTREGWNGKGMYLELQVPDAHSKMTRPYIYIKTVDDDFVPWAPSLSDILADDWYTLPLNSR